MQEILQEILFRNIVLICCTILLVKFHPVLLKMIYARDLALIELVLGLRFIVPFEKISIPVALPVFFTVRQMENRAASAVINIHSEALTEQFPVGMWVFTVWAVGFLCLIIFNLVQYIQLSCFVKEVRIAAEEEKYGQNIPVHYSSKVTNPFVFGIWNPVICLPEGLGETHKQMILSHEYAHIRRKDILKKEFYLLLCCLYWYNPAIWIWKRYACLSLELACDEAATGSMQSDQRKDYAAFLLTQSDSRDRARTHAVLFSGNVRRRIENLFYCRKRQYRCMAAFAAAALMLTTMLQPAYAESRDHTAFGLSCPSCDYDTLTRTVLYGPEQRSEIRSCIHFAYGTDQTGIFHKITNETCGNCHYEKQEEDLNAQMITDCQGYRSSEVTKDMPELMINTEALKNLDVLCNICGQERNIHENVFPAFCSGGSRSCIHGKMGYDEEINAPAMMTLECLSCGSKKYVFLKQYQKGWMCKGY